MTEKNIVGKAWVDTEHKSPEYIINLELTEDNMFEIKVLNKANEIEKKKCITEGILIEKYKKAVEKFKEIAKQFNCDKMRIDLNFEDLNKNSSLDEYGEIYG